MVFNCNFQDFYKKNSNHNKVAIGCVALMIIAYLSQTFLAHMTQVKRFIYSLILREQLKY